MKMKVLAFIGLLSGVVSTANAQKLPPESPKQQAQAALRGRYLSPIRLGGVFTMGLGDSGDWLEDSAVQGIKLSEANRRWMAENCDVAALPAGSLTPDTFRKTVQEQSLFTPLLFAFGSTLSEKPEAWGNAGGWQPNMTAWTLRDRNGAEVTGPEPGTHWMDFGNADWAAHWRKQMVGQAQTLGAAGMVISELPLGNTAVGDNLLNYRTTTDRADATSQWLQTVKKENQFALVPSALGFDSVAGHATLPVPPAAEQTELNGRLWNEFYPVSDGAWAEGWLAPYWAEGLLSEDARELHLEAAERAAENGQVFIAAGAYRNDVELEFLLASYLMVAHRQGRFVFQPMPLLPFFDRENAGQSFAVFRQQVISRRAYFDVPLGVAMQRRHIVPGFGVRLWRRAYQAGVVYVNSEDNRGMVLPLGGPMKRVTGEVVHQVALPPHSGGDPALHGSPQKLRLSPVCQTFPLPAGKKKHPADAQRNRCFRCTDIPSMNMVVNEEIPRPQDA